MYYLINHSFLIFLFFTIPFGGWLLSKLSKVALWIILIICSVLFSPILLGYNYIHDVNNGQFLYIALACWYALVVKNKNYKLTKVLLNTTICFLIFGFIGLMGYMFGVITIKNQWETKGYQIKYLEERGFSGGPLMRYQLNKYAKLPFLIKTIDGKIDTDSVKTCVIHFEKAKYNFDKCTIDTPLLIIIKH
jgi:hypothetical protein